MKNSKQKIAVIGHGVMGTIIINNLKKLGYKIIVIGRNDNIVKVNDCNVVILATKPQDFININPQLNKNTLIISIMAGTTIQKIKTQLKVSKIIRSMPNMPARINQGFIGWFATKQVTNIDKKFAEELFNKMGESIELSNEDSINKVTAIAGSGPAYVFHAIQSYINGAITLGIKESDARKMVFQTIRGSLAMIDEKTDLDILIKSVASKGGTTESALKVFNKKNTSKIWEEAIQKAYNRAKEL
ncbi:pyrroline-5-carboxylate reductase [Candidatus Nomurabacteria bacterium]|nr:pyrroline-5-carboxylate reductase [Candidatus Nomurabacteria bacterium]